MRMRIISYLLALTVICLPIFSLAQNNPVGDYAFITWQSNNYHPSDFIGKAMATNGTVVSATVNVMKNKTLQDLSSASISWYLDSGILSQGTGLNRISFKTTKTKGGIHTLRADIQTTDGVLSTAISIPIVLPKAVIVAPYPERTASPAEEVNLEAIPYFFNIKSFDDLSFSWIVNGQEQSGGNDNKLSLTLGPSSRGTLPVISRISNRNNRFESTQEKIEMSISQ